MSNLNPDPDKITANSNSKVIVLSMKNMPSFKFDPAKNFLAAGNEGPQQTVFSLKSQPSLQTAGAQKLQIVHQTPPVVQQTVTKIGQAGTIFIRAASGASTSKFTPITACPNVKIQEAPVIVHPANINKEISSSSPVTLTSFRNKVTNELTKTLKIQSGQTYVIQPSTKTHLTFPSLIPAVAAAKPATYSAVMSEQAPPLQRISVSSLKVTTQKKPVAIRPKIDAQKIILQQHVIIPPLTKAQVMPKFQNQQQKWVSGNPQMYPGPVPALTLIQPKPQSVRVPSDPESPVEDPKDGEINEIEYTIENENENSRDENSDLDDKEIDEQEEFAPIVEKTPERPKRTSQEERMLEVKRIIEGDQEDVHYTVVQPSPEKVSEESSQDAFECESEQVDSSSSMLLCDEKIETISPTDSEKRKEVTSTPKANDDDSKSSEVTHAVQEVKKNLDRELSLECDKENVDFVLEDDSISDTSSMTDSQRQKLQDYEESLMKSEITKVEATPPVAAGTYSKPKRIRKPKNPTVISTMGLPYKPPQPTIRKTKVEKKLEFELDFHDPLNKIQWEDGIGGLNNCNKLFGFDEFGLIEVIDDKDAKAKLRLLEGVDSALAANDGGSYKLRKLTDRADQFVCSVCAKFGTIRDFYTPECCSEACIAITKRKTGDYSAPVDRESESIDPVDERKLMYQGEMVPLQQLQHHLLEQQLPGKRKRSTLRPSVPIAENKFTWDTYLTAKSIPAPVELFKNPYPYKNNPFKVGMKLEAIDPESQKMICVCTVEEKLGFRVKLHFDGYPSIYDFWANADSPNIFPSGFCHSTNRVLQTPPKWSNKKFDWSEYLDYSNAIGAPRALFPRLAKPCEENPFEVGMKLETMRDGKIYAASIIDVIEDRVLISHDGHEELGCVWIDIFSPYLHPCNYHKTCKDPECFIPPSRPFDWPSYIKNSDAKEAPAEFLFSHKRNPFKFEAGLKLEVVDRVNRQLIRPATILCRDQFKIQVIFDGFDISFAYWLDDDSEDVHPINWCEKTGHPIEHPAGFNSLDNGLCQSPGCRGIGNGILAERYFHDTVSECPYSKINWKKLLNQKLGSHLDPKNLVKRGRNAPNRNSVNQKLLEMKNEYEEPEEDMSIDIEFPAVEVVIKRKGGRKSKRPAPPVAEDEDMDPVEEPPKKTCFPREFLADYGPQLNYSFELWKKNSKVLGRADMQGEFTENPLSWSVSKVESFIHKITSDPKVTEKFTAQAIDGHALVCLCQDDLVSLLDLKMGVAIKIYNRILHLRQEIMLTFFKI